MGKKSFLFTHAEKTATGGLKVYASGGHHNLAQGNALGLDEPPMISRP